MIKLLDYPTRQACMEALEIACRYFQVLEAAVPPAQWIPWEDQRNWRFVEQLPEHLVLQKLARQITAIQSADLLLLSGYLQEIGVLYRTLDEIAEDAAFVCLGLKTDSWTLAHDEYVRFFWSEDVSDRQPPVRRNKIRSFVNRAYGNPDPSTADENGRKIHKTFSDYTHARSAPIVAMIHGPPSRFDLGGILDDEARHPYVAQNPSYFYRTLVSASMISNVVLTDRERSLLYDEVKEFERRHQALLF